MTSGTNRRAGPVSAVVAGNQQTGDLLNQLTVDGLEFPARSATEGLGSDAVDVPKAAVVGFMKHGDGVGGKDGRATADTF